MNETDTSGADCGHVRNVSATERLRELLDERGVKWKEWKDPDTTAWFDGSHAVRAEEYDGQLLVERIMTPEQAIAATLGRGTCHIVMISPGWWECDECANSIDWDSCDPNDPPSCDFCPSCGRKVV